MYLFFWLVYMYSLDWFPWSGWVFSRSCRVDKKKLGEVFFFSGFLAFFFCFIGWAAYGWEERVDPEGRTFFVFVSANWWLYCVVYG